MTSVLFEAVKVDNDIKIFNPAGQQYLQRPKAFERLDYACFQPNSSFKKPNLGEIKRAAAKKAAA